jgi:hypothetical protein
MDAFDYLSAQLKEEIAAIKEGLATGAVKDYAEYQNLCGKIRGLLTAQSKLEDLKERMENSDE